jgi:uncharacterized protein YkwD
MPMDGSWIGDTVFFTASGGQLHTWQVTGISCFWVSEDPNFPEQCARTAHFDEPFEVAVNDGKVLFKEGDLAIQGSFVAPDRVKGTWSYQPSDCCTSVGTWTGHHESWVPEPDVTEPDGVPPPPPVDTIVSVDVPAGWDAMPSPGCTLAESATAQQVEAVQRVNWYRENVGVPCVNLLETINQAAQQHADYYGVHIEAYKNNKIPGGAHSEDPAFAEGFTGVSFGNRMKAAGYTGQPGFEIMTFIGNPTAAVDGWVETVYHRIPVMSPDMIDTGYGARFSAPRVDVMDFGRLNAGDNKLIVVYPFPGQTGVPRVWGGHENPQPPPPPEGYPSGSVITVHIATGVPLTIEAHKLTDSAGAAVDHMWLARGSDPFLTATWAMYAHKPLAVKATYTVSLAGTWYDAPWDTTWSFTTQ